MHIKCHTKKALFFNAQIKNDGTMVGNGRIKHQYQNS